MLLSELFNSSLEPELKAWINKFESPIDLLNAIPQLFSGLGEQVVLGQVRDYVSISGPVHIGRGTVINSGVVIEGPVIIGENVSVRSHAQIRKMSYVGSDCVVGHGADIKESLCMNGAKIQDGTFVGDSILGFAVRIGSGAIIANRRFDQSEIMVKAGGRRLVPSSRKFMGAVLGDYVRIGANCVLLPGTIIGPHTWVNAGVVLHGTHGPDLLILEEKKLKIIHKRKRVLLVSGRGEYEHI